MALRALKQTQSKVGTSSTRMLFRDICRQVPTVLTIYDVDMTVTEARGVVKAAFAKNAGVTDARTIAILNHKGRTELQEATLQYKTKAQLMAFLERITKTDKQLAQEADEDAGLLQDVGGATRART
ncbi:hypothetical protein JL722_7154 [Aureococcus anophagefferens]|nr:hypothetical protein JL722_7154 [Aureococcus anophagefferens]